MSQPASVPAPMQKGRSRVPNEAPESGPELLEQTVCGQSRGSP